MSVKPIKRIIFDNDGVNIDSEHVAMGDMDAFGYNLVSCFVDPVTAGLQQRQIYVEYKGLSSNLIIKRLMEKYSLPEDAVRAEYKVPEGADLYEFLSDLHTKSVIKRFQTGELQTIPGFVETMKTIRDQYGRDNIALCTTSREDRMHASVHAVDSDTGEDAKWGDMFPDQDNLRVSGYGYPNKYDYFRELHPDWDPEETAIVEDTAGSTKKAIAAGFKNVIGIVASKFQCLDDDGNYDREKQRKEVAALKEAGARVIVTDFRDIPKAVEWMDNGMNMDNIPDFKGEVYNSNPLLGHIAANHGAPALKQ